MSPKQAVWVQKRGVGYGLGFTRVSILPNVGRSGSINSLTGKAAFETAR